MKEKKGFDFELNQYGFKWGDVIVERTASHYSKRVKWQVIRVFTPIRVIFEIQITPRKVKINQLKIKLD